MGSSASLLNESLSPDQRETLVEALLKKCEEILVENPDNRCCKYVLEFMKDGKGKTLSDEGKYMNVNIPTFSNRNKNWLTHLFLLLIFLKMPKSSTNASKLESKTLILALDAMR